MIPLRALCDLVSSRSKAALKKSAGKAADPAACSQSLTAPLGKRLLQACRKHGPLGLQGEQELLPLAFPERFVAGISIFAGNLNSVTSIPAHSAALLVSARKQEAQFLHLDADTSRVDSVLLCHGLSPQGDSLVLIAELGRALRVSQLLGLPVQVMLLDPQWQMLNRSAQRAAYLGRDVLPRLLQDNAVRRCRLYSALGMAPRLVSLSLTILNPVVERLCQLTDRLWRIGDRDNLSIENCRAIAAPLSEEDETDWQHELVVLRFLTREFNSLSSSVMLYFFGQFMAQEPFRRSSLKLAVQSEAKFDSAFEVLDASLRSVLRLPEAEATGLARVYVPHYRLGDARVLPYMPLSLDAVCDTTLQNEEAVWKLLVSVDEPPPLSRLEAVLKATPLAERNRLCADVASFVLGVLHVPAAASTVEDETLAQINAALSALGKAFVESFQRERAWSTPEAVREGWRNWLDSIGVEDATASMPLHLLFAMMDHNDWTDAALANAGHLCLAAAAVYRSLCESGA